MKRNELVNILIKEGFSEKTLVRFSDKQLVTLSNRFVTEQQMKGAVIMKKQSLPTDVKKITDTGVNVELREKKGKKDGDVEEASRTMANGYHGGLKKMKYKAGRKDKECETKEIYLRGGKTKDGDDHAETILDKDRKIVSQKIIDKKSGKLKEKKKDNPKEMKEWVEKLVENKYHSLTTKNEIMELITSKLNEVDIDENSPQTKPNPGTSPAPTTIPKPGTRPEKPKRENPFEPKHNPKPKAKLPKFMEFKNIGIRLKNSK